MDLIYETSFMPFKYYYQFYFENNEKIHMKESDGVGQHPVNREAVARWIQRIGRLEDEDERKFYLFFARAFASILETSYVPYTQFLSTVQAMAYEISEKIKTENYEQIIFVVAGELEKSNVWISLLCMDYWNENQPHMLMPATTDKIKVLSFVTDPPKLDHLLLAERKTLFLHFDDMSYSGGQAAQSIYNLWRGVRDARKIRTSTVDYYVAMPYVTQRAKAYIIEHIPGVKFFDATVQVPNFLEQVQTYYDALPEAEKEENRVYLARLQQMCDKEWMHISNRSRIMAKYSPPNAIEKGIWAFRCSTYKTLIYFDHKLADDASTFQKVLYFGAYPMNNFDDVCEFESLIQNCSVHPDVIKEMKDRRINPCYDYIEVLSAKKWNINQKVICPKTFYKGIDYTYSYEIKRVRNEGGVKLQQQAYHLDKRTGLWDNLYIFYSRTFLMNLQYKMGAAYGKMNYEEREDVTNRAIEKTLIALPIKQSFLTPSNNTPKNTREWVNIGEAIPNNAFKNTSPGWTSLWGLIGGKTRKQTHKAKKRATRVVSKRKGYFKEKKPNPIRA